MFHLESLFAFSERFMTIHVTARLRAQSPQTLVVDGQERT
jgi:hypothetical protein